MKKKTSPSQVNRQLAKNTSSLLFFQLAKIIFPLLILPYLTRVLSTNAYGTVSYVKTIMTYLQLLVDFGFVLSGTRDIVKARNDQKKIQKVLNETMTARLILGFAGFLITIIVALLLPITRENFLFTILSYISIFLSIFLMDFLFRGLEKMHVITIRFVIMKIISTVFTFLFVKNDSNLLLIPIFDIISSIMAVLLIQYELRKLHLSLHFSRIKHALKKIKESFIFFLSNVASTSLNAFSTIIVGIVLTMTDVAFWGVCMQIIGTIQACYNPISNGIYPEMVRNRNLRLLAKILKIFTPLVLIGSTAVAILANWILGILGGSEYQSATIILQITTPCLFFGFLAIMLGWPALGALGYEKYVTKSTIITLIFNIAGIVLLIINNSASLISIAIVRMLSDFVLFISRLFYLLKYHIYKSHGKTKHPGPPTPIKEKSI